jgi:hypothetical protein
VPDTDGVYRVYQHRSLLNRPKSMARMVADPARLRDHGTGRPVQISHGMRGFFRQLRLTQGAEPCPMAILIPCSRVCLVLALLAAGGFTRADEQPKPRGGFKPPSDFADKATQYMSARAGLTGFSGTVLVAHHGRPLFREG